MEWQPCMSFIASCASIQYGNGKSLMRLKRMLNFGIHSSIGYSFATPCSSSIYAKKTKV